MARQHEHSGERGCHVDDVPEEGVHNDFSNGDQGRIRWMEVNDYDGEGSQNNGMHKDFLGISGGFGNVQLEAREDGPESDIYDVALVC